MPRKLPLCAGCGKSLAGRGQIRMSWGGIAGNPEVGWHAYAGAECFKKETLRPELIRDLKEDSEHHDAVRRMLSVIQRRGPGRVVANKAWEG